jgi:hypothetical protein
MTLTQTDLNAIGSVIDQKLDEKLEPIKKDLKKLRKDTTYIIGALDKELMRQTKRIDRIENHQHLLPVAD